MSQLNPNKKEDPCDCEACYAESLGVKIDAECERSRSHEIEVCPTPRSSTGEYEFRLLKRTGNTITPASRWHKGGTCRATAVDKAQIEFGRLTTSVR